MSVKVRRAGAWWGESRGELRGELSGDVRGEGVFAPLWAIPVVGKGGTARLCTATSLYVFRPPEAGRFRMLGLSNYVEGSVWLDRIVAWRVPVLVGLVVVLVVARGLKVWLRARALRGRTVAKVLLPSPKFNPSPEEVRRVAAVLSRIHRATRGPGTRDAYGVRLLLRPDRCSGLVQLELHGHERARSVLDLVSFDQTESKPVDDPDTDWSVITDPSSDVDVAVVAVGSDGEAGDDR